MTLTQERLKELLHYDPETGIFTRNVYTHYKAQPGMVAGGLVGKGYIRIRVDVKPYYAHILAWFYMYGVWPDDQIDHIDENKLNNRIANLRQATNTQNSQNKSKPQANNTSGYRGVSFDKSRNKWVAYLDHKRLGGFDTAEQASAAYLSAKAVHHPYAFELG